jgi:hypothetical protein
LGRAGRAQADGRRPDLGVGRRYRLASCRSPGPGSSSELGCHNINWVTPERVVPQILEALPLAVDAGLHLPIVYNTSADESPRAPS